MGVLKIEFALKVPQFRTKYLEKVGVERSNFPAEERLDNFCRGGDFNCSKFNLDADMPRIS